MNSNHKISIIMIITLIAISAFALFGGINENPTAVAAADNDNQTATTYQLQINTSGKWKMDLTIDGNYTSYDEEGSKTINLGDSVSIASVTVNQKSNGPTHVYLLKENKTIKEESSKGEGIETIYLYYQE